jgi:hypothetical protein
MTKSKHAVISVFRTRYGSTFNCGAAMMNRSELEEIGKMTVAEREAMFDAMTDAEKEEAKEILLQKVADLKRKQADVLRQREAKIALIEEQRIEVFKHSVEMWRIKLKMLLLRLGALIFFGRMM